MEKHIELSLLIQVKTLSLQLSAFEKIFSDLFPESYNEYLEERSRLMDEDEIFKKLLREFDKMKEEIEKNNPGITLKSFNL